MSDAENFPSLRPVHINRSCDEFCDQVDTGRPTASESLVALKEIWKTQDQRTSQSRQYIALIWCWGTSAALPISVYNPRRHQDVVWRNPNESRVTEQVFRQLVRIAYWRSHGIELCLLTSSTQVERCSEDGSIFLAACAISGLAALYITQRLHARHKHQQRFLIAGALLGLAASFVCPESWWTGKTAISYIPLGVSVALAFSIVLHEAKASWRWIEDGKCETSIGKDGKTRLTA